MLSCPVPYRFAARFAQKKKFLLYQQNHLLKKGYQKYFVTTTKCLVPSTKRLGAAPKFLVAATKILFVVPNFVAVTKPFFFRDGV